MTYYEKVTLYIVDNFYSLLSYDVGLDINLDDLQDIIDRILCEGVKFKQATNGLTPLTRAALKASFRDILSNELFIMGDNFVGIDSVNKLVKLWKENC